MRIHCALIEVTQALQVHLTLYSTTKDCQTQLRVLPPSKPRANFSIAEDIEHHRSIFSWNAVNRIGAFSIRSNGDPG